MQGYGKMLKTSKQWQFTPTEDLVLSGISYATEEMFGKDWICPLAVSPWQNWNWGSETSTAWRWLVCCLVLWNYFLYSFSVHRVGIFSQYLPFEPAPIVCFPTTVAGKEVVVLGRVLASAFHWCCLASVALIVNCFKTTRSIFYLCWSTRFRIKYIYFSMKACKKCESRWESGQHLA